MNKLEIDADKMNNQPFSLEWKKTMLKRRPEMPGSSRTSTPKMATEAPDLQDRAESVARDIAVVQRDLRTNEIQ